MHCRLAWSSSDSVYGARDRRTYTMVSGIVPTSLRNLLTFMQN